LQQRFANGVEVLQTDKRLSPHTKKRFSHVGYDYASNNTGNPLGRPRPPKTGYHKEHATNGVQSDFNEFDEIGQKSIT
jgi:hypothetical protein